MFSRRLDDEPFGRMPNEVERITGHESDCPLRGGGQHPDIFATGIVLYETIAGRMMYPEGHDMLDRMLMGREAPEGPSKTTRLIGRVCTHSNVFSLPVLIGRAAWPQTN